MRRKSVRTLARTAVTALAKPDDFVVEAGHGAVDWIFSKLPQRSRLDRLIEATAAELQPLAGAEYGGAEILEVAVERAQHLFARHGLSGERLVALGLRPDAATRELLEVGHAILGAGPLDRDPAQALCCNEIVPRVHRVLLNDPESIRSLGPEITCVLLAQRGEIAALPDRVGEVLRQALGRRLLVYPVQPLPALWRDIHLLQAEYAIVPPHEEARREELSELREWCVTDPAPRAVRLMTGPGGTGKSRLAIELCRAVLRERWRAGFLHRGMPEVPSWELDGLLEGEQPLLLVVDYAETRRGLVPLLDRLARTSAGPRTRILLLARDVGGLVAGAAALDCSAPGVPGRRLRPGARAPADRAGSG